MQYDNIYNYKISYVDELGIKDICNIYSDNSDIYSLENLPDTTYFINVYHCAKKDASTTFSGSYLVGKPISLAELEEEMILTEHSDDIVYHHYLKKAYNEITSTGKPYTIFRIKNRLICLTNERYQGGKLVGEIKGGKIVKATENAYSNDNYTELE